MDCPSDGKHVPWSSEDLLDGEYGEPQKQCYKLGEQGPCPEGSTLVQLKLAVTCKTADKDSDDMDGQESVYSRAPMARTNHKCARGSPKCI